MNYHHLLPIDEFKIRAAVLLKSLRSTEPEKSLSAAARFKLLPELSEQPVELIIKNNTELRHKHALRVIALENGYYSWHEFKENLEKGNDSIKLQMNDREILGRISSGGFLNNWYSTYEEAKSCLELKGGYLLVYKNHFFVCEHGYIEALGLDPEDPDWDKIGRDWEKPNDLQAWNRLYKKLIQLHA